MTALQKRSARAASLAGILSNKTRVSIILFLHAKRGSYVQDIIGAIGTSQSATSHQLSLLAQAGVVSFEKEGRDVFYTLSKKHPTRLLLKALRSL